MNGYFFACMYFVLALQARANCPASSQDRSLLSEVSFDDNHSSLILPPLEVPILVLHNNVEIPFGLPPIVAPMIISSSSINKGSSVCIYPKYEIQTFENTSLNTVVLPNNDVTKQITALTSQWHGTLANKKELAQALVEQAEGLNGENDLLFASVWLTAINALFEIADYSGVIEQVKRLDNDAFPSRYRHQLILLRVKAELIDRNTNSAISLLEKAASLAQHHLFAAEIFERQVLLLSAFLTADDLENGQRIAKTMEQRWYEHQYEDHFSPRLKARYYDVLGHLHLVKFYHSDASDYVTLDAGIEYEYRALAETLLSQDIEQKMAMHSNTAWLLRASGRISSATKHFLIALYYLEQTDNTLDRLYLYRNLGQLYLQLGGYQKALSFFIGAKQYADAATPFWSAKLDCLLAQTYWQMNTSEQARLSARQCQQKINQLVAMNNSPDYLDLSVEALALAINLEQDYGANNDQYLARINQSIEQIADIEAKIRVLMMLAKWARQTGNNDLAGDYVNQARPIVQKSSNITTKTDFLMLAHDILPERFQAEISAEFLALVDRVSVQLDAAELGPVWRHKVARFINNRIIWLANEGNQQAALQLYLRYQGISLRGTRHTNDKNSSNVRQSLTRLNELTSSALVTKQSTQQHQIAISKSLLLLTGNASDSDPQMSELQRYARDGLSNPSRAQLGSNLTIPDFAAQFQQGHVALFYIKGETQYWLFIINEQTIDFVPVGDSANIDDAITSFMSLMQSPEKAYLTQSKNLAERLLPSTLPLSSLTRISLITDGALSHLPFSALIVGSGEYLADIASVSRILQYEMPQKTEHNQGSTLQFAMFGNPVFNQRSANLAPLPWSAQEATWLQTLFNSNSSTYFLTTDANKTNLMSQQVRNARILHISTHHHYDQNQPGLMGFSLSPVNDDVASSIVSYQELFNYPFNNHLVFINGCSSALGWNASGEGLQSMARGFLVSGAENVVATLWPISEKPSAELSRHFYSHLLRGNSIPKALQYAQLTLKSKGRFSHPFYWAGYAHYSFTGERD